MSSNDPKQPNEGETCLLGMITFPPAFSTRFKKATMNTPAEYLQRIKIEAAKKSLETTRKNVNEVMYDIGYNDTKAFRLLFKKITGLSPLDYRNKYNKDAVVY